MKLLRENISRWLRIGLLIILSLVCLLALKRIAATTNLGSHDFAAYWSAVYLVRHGLNPYDPELMRTLQQTQLQVPSGGELMAWNPPFLFVFLLPLAWLSFTTAKFVWLTINIVIILSAGLMLAQIYFPTSSKKTVLLYLLYGMFLPQVMAGVSIGQVTFLVYFGVAACMMFIKKGQWFWAGAVLILTTIKPHIVVLPLIYLLLYMAQRRQYQGWLGLIFAGLVCLAILFLFRQHWISDLMGELTIAPYNWSTPTIGGLMSYWHLTEAARYMIILLLPLPFILARYETFIKFEFAVALLTLITVPTTFYGWSFDQTILLIPIAQVFAWIDVTKHKMVNVGFVAAIVIALILNYFQRLLNTNDVFYVWIPFFWWVIFALKWCQVSSPALAKASST